MQTTAPASAPATGGTISDIGNKATEAAATLTAKTEQTVNQAWAFAKIYGPDIIAVFVIMFVAWVLGGWARRTVRRGLERARFDLTLTKFFANMVRWMILAVAVVMCLGRFGVQTATFAALFGVAGLAIGLGFQGSLSNLAAGVMLLVFRPFKVGDGVVVGGNSGIINEIDMFQTSLDTADGRRIIIPNGAIFGATIENSTFHPQRRIDVSVSVAGSADVAKTEAVLLKAVTGTPGVLQDPAPAVVLVDLGVNWSVQAWAATGELGGVRQQLLKNIKDALGKAEIPGPRPGMDVNVPAVAELVKFIGRGTALRR